MFKKTAVGALIFLFAASLTVGAQPDLWLHVYVEEGGENGETVRINLPLSVIQDVLPHIEVDEFQRGMVDIVDDIEAEGIDIRAIWEGLRGSPDGDFVTVRGSSENVRVSKSEGYLLVNVDQENERVRVRLPVEVVDALFTGTDDDQLNLIAAIEALSRHAGEEIVTVESGTETVRIWIDNEAEGRL